MPLQNTECLVPISDVGFFPAKLVHPAERLAVQVASGEDWLCRWYLTKQQGYKESVTWGSPRSFGNTHKDKSSNPASGDTYPPRRYKTSAERRRKFRDALAGYSREYTSSNNHESVGVPQQQQMGLGTPLGFAAKGVSADQLEAFKERLERAGGQGSNTSDMRDSGGLVAAAPPGVDVVEVGPGRHVLRSKGDATAAGGGASTGSAASLPYQAGGKEGEEIVEIRETEEYATIQGTRSGRGRAGDDGSGGHATAAVHSTTGASEGSSSSSHNDKHYALQPLPAGAASSSPDPPQPAASAPAPSPAQTYALSSRLDALEAAEARARKAAGGAGAAEWEAYLLDLDQERRRARARELEGAQRWAEGVLKRGGGVTSEAGAGAGGPAYGTQRRVPGASAPAREPTVAAPAPAPASAPSQPSRFGGAGAAQVQAPSLPAGVTSAHAAPRHRSRPRSIIGDVVERRPVATAVHLGAGGAGGSSGGAAAAGAGAPRMSKFRAARLARQQGRG